MKTHFIRINDISDINVAKATVYDLSNRYIDSKGNMYGLRYNRDTRKIDIIRIIRTPVKSAGYFQNKLVRQKRQSRADNGQRAPGGAFGAVPEGEVLAEGEAGEGAEAVELEFDPERYLEETLELMKTHRDRFNGIMMNIKNSKIVPDNDRAGNISLSDIFRNLDIDGIQRIEKILTSHKELKNYPRSITYYQSKLDQKGRDILEALPDDTRKMKFIYFFEQFHAIRNLYRTLSKIISDLQFFLEEKKPDEIKNLTFAEKQFHEDAKISINNTIKDINGVMREIGKLEKFLYEVESFM